MDHVNSFPYLTMCIKEGLRLYGPAQASFRVMEVTKTIENVTFHKGETVAISTAWAGRNPKVWSDPLTFDPDRFLPENEKKIPPGAFMPFLCGPRDCIGKNIALTSSKLIIATFVHNFAYKIGVQGYQYTVSADFTIRPNKGLPLILKQRY